MSKSDYEVGYGKPPKAHQFKTGKSGNPKGRPKGARGLKTDLREELNQKVSFTENGQVKTLRKQQLLVRQLAAKALKGEMGAIKQLADMTISLLGAEDEMPKGSRTLSDEDQAILAAYTARANRGDDND